MSDQSRLRIVVLRVVVLSILVTLFGRLVYLQVAQGQGYREAAQGNRIRQVITPAARGQILDDRGVALVGNRTALVVSVTRSIVRSQPEHGKAVLERLGKVVGIPAAQIAQLITPCGEKQKDGTRAKAPNCWNGSPLQAVPIKSYNAANSAEVRRVLAIEEHAEDFPGVQAKYAAVREYPQASLAAHILGYLGPLSEDDLKKAKYKDRPSGSLIGRAGLEDVYDDQLRGVDGVQRLLVDKDATVTGTLGTVEAKAGDNLVLSVDAGVQKVVEDALRDGILAARAKTDRNRGVPYKAPKGAAIVMEAGSGRVVAMASYPTFDPTVFVGGISTKEYRALLGAPGSPLISNAVQGLYAPGSTFKIVSTAGAVTAGYPLTPRIYDCPGQYRIGNSVKHNFEGESFATLDFRETLIRSCDTVYYKLAVDQWSADGGNKAKKGAREVFVKMARAWGFGKKTGIDLPDERSGLITDRAYKQRFYDQNKAIKCKRAREGYPDEAKTDPARAALLQEYAKEFCTDGYRYNAGDAANFIIGQGDVLVTPLQLTAAYAAMANGGTLYKPQLAKGFVSADGTTYSELPPVTTGKLPVSRQVLDYMRSALGGVVLPPGTAKGSYAGFPLSQLAVGGKTGTADVNGKSPTSWFASFAPVSAPKYVTVVMIPEGGTGGTTAAPISRKIWDGMYGLEGKKGVLGPAGTLPTTLPVVRPDGTIAAPGTRVPRPAVKVTPSSSATPSPGTSRALSGAVDLPWAEPVRRYGQAQ